MPNLIEIGLLVLEKIFFNINICTQSSRLTFLVTSHSDLLPPRKYKPGIDSTGPTKNIQKRQIFALFLSSIPYQMI